MKIAFYVLGGLFVFIGVVAMFTASFPVGLIMALIGAYLIYYAVKYKKPVKVAPAVTESALARAVEQSKKIKIFKVAGVTFSNEDGKSRQAILKRLAKDDDYSDFELNKYKFNGETAIAVVVDGNCIGNIRKSDIREVLSLLNENCVYSVDIDDFEDEDGVTIYRADVIFNLGD